MVRLTATEGITSVADEGSFVRWEGRDPTAETGISPQYIGQLTAAARATGTDESVVAGTISLGGVPSAILAWEFGFLGGSVGTVTAQRVVAAVRRATREGRPIVVIPRSGGTRMQEGAPAFVRMVGITAAISDHRRAGLPYLVHLGDPVSGGVLATLGSLGDRTTAEPGAMVGFLGPRAVRAIIGRDLPPGVQSAENLARVGIVDQVVETSGVRDDWVRLLRAWQERGRVPEVDVVEQAPPPGPRDVEDLWRRIERSRNVDRPGAPDVLDRFVTETVDLAPDGGARAAEGVRVCVGRLFGAPGLFVATTDRRTGAPLTVAGLRSIQRGVDLAGRWGLPVVCLVDTLGARLDRGAEESGVAREVARTMLALLEAPVPSVSLLVGPGTGGAALPMLAADRVVATAGSWVSPRAPEGAAAIRPTPGVGAAQVAWQQRVGADALAEIGVVDLVVRDEGPGWLPQAVGTLAAALAEACTDTDRTRRVRRFGAWI